MHPSAIRFSVGDYNSSETLTDSSLAAAAAAAAERRLPAQRSPETLRTAEAACSTATMTPLDSSPQTKVSRSEEQARDARTAQTLGYSFLYW